VTRALQRMYQLALVFGARSGDTLGNNLPLFSDEALQPLLVLVVDVLLFGSAEPARTLLAWDLVVPIPSWSSL
jgi:hypothetical protein